MEEITVQLQAWQEACNNQSPFRIMLSCSSDYLPHSETMKTRDIYIFFFTQYNCLSRNNKITKPYNHDRIYGFEIFLQVLIITLICCYAIDLRG